MFVQKACEKLDYFLLYKDESFHEYTLAQAHTFSPLQHTGVGVVLLTHAHTQVYAYPATPATRPDPLQQFPQGRDWVQPAAQGPTCAGSGSGPSSGACGKFNGVAGAVGRGSKDPITPPPPGPASANSTAS